MQLFFKINNSLTQVFFKFHFSCKPWTGLDRTTKPINLICFKKSVKSAAEQQNRSVISSSDKMLQTVGLTERWTVKTKAIYLPRKHNSIIKYLNLSPQTIYFLREFKNKLHLLLYKIKKKILVLTIFMLLTECQELATQSFPWKRFYLSIAELIEA